MRCSSKSKPPGSVPGMLGSEPGKSALPQRLPLTLGSDLAGEIIAVGPGASDLRVGDQVYGLTNPQFLGAYAEFALASTAMVSKKPASLNAIEAASVPVVAVTAWQALFGQGHLEAGRTVVIHGAAGNVGAYAVQLAHGAGMRIIATAAADDISFLRNFGADRVFDYRTEPFEEEVRDADAVIDLIGGETQARSFQVLRRGGKLISAVSNPDPNLARVHGVDATFFLVNVTSQCLAEIAALIDSGKPEHTWERLHRSRMRAKLISCWNEYGLCRKVIALSAGAS